MKKNNNNSGMEGEVVWIANLQYVHKNQKRIEKEIIKIKFKKKIKKKMVKYKEDGKW